MRWILRLGAYRGIDVYLHATFLLLLGFLAVSFWLASPKTSESPLHIAESCCAPLG